MIASLFCVAEHHSVLDGGRVRAGLRVRDTKASRFMNSLVSVTNWFQPCCCLPWERCSSTLSLYPSSWKRWSGKESPVNCDAAAFSFPLVRLLNLISCFSDGRSQPGTRNAMVYRLDPRSNIQLRHSCLFLLKMLLTVEDINMRNFTFLPTVLHKSILLTLFPVVMDITDFS